MTDWPTFRSQMPVTGQFAYFDHAAVAPLSQPARQAVDRWSREAAELGDTVWPRWAERVEQVRRVAAAAIGAETAEVAFVASTTAGINLVAEGLDWRPGDNVVVPSNEFPSNLYPWLNLAARGVETRQVDPVDGRLDISRIEQACDSRTRLVACSWVGYASGFRVDVGQLVDRIHRRGALVLLDAIQGLGVFPLDVRQVPVDFLAADGHKWLLGPEGAGLFYTRRRHLGTLRPLGVGWNSVSRPYDFSDTSWRPRDTAARYEGGSQNMVGIAALGASLELLVAHGLAATRSAIGERVLAVSDEAVARLQALGAEIDSDRSPGAGSGIVQFSLPGRDPAEVRRECLAANVVLSCRGRGLRISPHAYTDETDLDRLIGALSR